MTLKDDSPNLCLTCEQADWERGECREEIEGYFDDEIEKEEDDRSFCPICHQETYECVCGKVKK